MTYIDVYSRGYYRLAVPAGQPLPPQVPAGFKLIDHAVACQDAKWLAEIEANGIATWRLEIRFTETVVAAVPQ